jgi:hypothetical protein
MLRRLCLLVALSSAVSCRSATAPDAQLVLEHRAKWEARHLTRYAYIYEETGFFICCTEGKQIRLVVLNGVVSSAQFVDTNEFVPGSPTVFPTIDGFLIEPSQLPTGSH